MLDRIAALGDRLLTRLVPTTNAAAAQCWRERCGQARCAAKQCCISAGTITCGNCYAVC